MNLRARTIIIRAAIATIALPAMTALAIPAFPGADGFGGNALGGRGGDVYHVTSLADTLTPGTLRYGLRESGFPALGRTIVFDIGGTINLTADLDVKNLKKVTIAGQTAPGHGITLTGFKLQVTSSSGKSTEDIIIRYLSSRRGPANGADDAIGVLGSGTAQNVIIDHCSSSWALDEIFSVTNNSTNVTIQNNYITEALDSAGHAYGSLVRPRINSNVSYLHNLYADNRSRNPRPGTYNGDTLAFDFRNNVIYNWSDRAGYTGGASEADIEHVYMNYMGNYAIAGPSTPAGQKSNTAFTKDTSDDPLDLKVYQLGNFIDSNHNATRDGADTGWGMFITSNGGSTSAFPEADKMASPFAYPMAATDSASDAYEKALASGGYFPWNRDAIDARIINQVKTNTGSVIATPNATEWNNVVNAPTYTRPGGWDTDADGMPNSWELSRGLNPNLADNNDPSATGYTNLENYLNDLTLVAAWSQTGGGSWNAFLNWAGARPELTDATAVFGQTISAPSTVTIDAPVSAGQISFDSPINAYTIGGNSMLTLSVISGYASVDVLSGSHAITAPFTLANNTVFTTAAGTALAINGPFSATAVTLTKNGTGTLVLPNIRAASLIVNQGLVKIATNGSASAAGKVQTLAIAGGTTPTATLDLSNNDLIVGNGTSRATIETQIAYARNGGAWDRAGITSSAAADDTQQLTALGVLSGAEYTSVGGDGTFDGLSYLPSDTLVKFTYLGDTDFNEVVDGADYARIDTTFNNETSTQTDIGGWINGDFDLNGKVDGADYALIDSAFNGQSGPPLGMATVPEPASAVVGIAAAGVVFAPRTLRRRPFASKAAYV